MNANALIATAILACMGELLLLALTLRHGGRTPLVGPLVALCVVVFGWNFAAMAHQLSGGDEWRWLDVSLSPFSTPLAVHFAIAFTGRRQKLRAFLWLIYVPYALLALAGVLSFFLEPARHFVVSRQWAIVHLVLIAAGMSAVAVLLVTHYVRSVDEPERLRTRVLFAAMAVAALLGPSDVMVDAGIAVPRLGNVGILVGNVLLASVVLRVDAFERKPTFADALAAGALALIFVGLVLVAVYTLDRPSAVAALASGTAVLAVLGAGRIAVRALRADRAQIQQLATLGRLSTQLAHDLKNPLAAFRGAAQFLQVEAERGSDLRPHKRFFDILIEQADRMQRVIDAYQRLGKMTPHKTESDLNRVTSSVLQLQQFAAGDRITVRAELAPTLPPCPVDPELLGNALENLLANAFQVLPSGGEVTITTRTESVDGRRLCVLAVADNGPGMDARTRDRAGEDFFTTRPDGTGLGLAFVRRICLAHGGNLVIETARGRGTRMEMWLPCEAPRA